MIPGLRGLPDREGKEVRLVLRDCRGQKAKKETPGLRVLQGHRAKEASPALREPRGRKGILRIPADWNRLRGASQNLKRKLRPQGRKGNLEEASFR